MPKFVRLCVFFAFVFISLTQVSMARDFADIYTDCGLGAMIAPKNSAVAAVTNVTWDSGTTAISSNITSPDTCKGGQDRTAAFIHQSYASLEKDLASGSGKYLSTLTQLTGADPVALRNKFAKVVATPGYSTKTRYEKSEILYNLIYKNG